MSSSLQFSIRTEIMCFQNREKGSLREQTRILFELSLICYTIFRPRVAFREGHYYSSKQEYLNIAIIVSIGKIMRQYILTEKERNIIMNYLRDRKPSNLIDVLRHRGRRYLGRLKEDISLLETLIE